MSGQAEKLAQLRGRARQIRRHIISMVGEAGSGHPGGSLSAADIVTALYFDVMRVDPQKPQWPERDRFVLSKGHAAPVLYAALAERGYFPVEDLKTLRKLGSPLQGHPDMRKTPGVEMSTGSLGQGLSAANGMALAGKLDGLDYRVYVLLGDGEIEEGQIWEAAMAAAHFKLDNVIAFLDYNGLQIDGPVEEVMSAEPVADKWRAFGWAVQEIDGHDMEQILAAVAQARETRGKPSLIIARTVKGKGVSFMENEVGWHGAAPKPEQVEQALAELGE
ncbi:transketolase [Desulfallas thermosapovorans]|uniref:Transketolase n=1 Tax=Desulfallas thermosapovorans DSM 6562 TaxID=1121431 RepID=A0A5S4ZRU7_9FIRM|nr:transketolase [Desulfallas thermosapovorans]TYO94816.1 transketolase [Desulfallas thermosapovorans DSM 6562]